LVTRGMKRLAFTCDRGDALDCFAYGSSISPPTTRVRPMPSRRKRHADLQLLAADLPFAHCLLDLAWRAEPRGSIAAAPITWFMGKEHSLSGSSSSVLNFPAVDAHYHKSSQSVSTQARGRYRSGHSRTPRPSGLHSTIIVSFRWLWTLPKRQRRLCPRRAIAELKVRY
jgi:hypothetical protein